VRRQRCLYQRTRLVFVRLFAEGQIAHIEYVDAGDADEILLPGVHNVENYLAAAAAVIEYVEPSSVKKVATEFGGVEHRLELAGEVNGVRYYNDSIATSPTRTIAGLYSFKHKVILIAGGYDKNISYDEMGEVLAEKIEKLILIGPTSDKIEAALKNQINLIGKGKDVEIIHCENFDDTVSIAYKNAKPGDIVLLSPASASFDLFKNFEERGNRFKELVKKLTF
jgi:UDP-N-acetylmuramoylalanine--D-glutamate ligase